MGAFRIVVIGGSAGAVEGCLALIPALPADLDAAVFIVLHLSPSAPSLLAELLARRASMRVTWACDGAEIQPGTVYVAPPDHHLLIEDGHISLGRGPREGGHRPAVDPLFRTAAHTYCERVIGVVLSGNLDDGRAGLEEILRMGGQAIVQDPREALYSSMPESALALAGLDAATNLRDIPQRITKQVSEERTSGSICDELPEDIAAGGQAPLSADERETGQLAPYGCPDCGGALWQLKDGEMVRYRCRVGHSYTDESLLEANANAVERAMWASLRALAEHSSQAHRLADRMKKRGHNALHDRFLRQALEAEDRAMIIRKALLKTANDSTTTTE